MMHSGASSLPSRRATAGAVACLLAAGLAGGTVRSATAQGISAQVDGRQVHLQAHVGQDPREALTRNGIAVGEHDAVTPAGELHDGDMVTVRRAHHFTLTLDGHDTQEWTVAKTVGEALAVKLGPTLTGAAVDQPRDLPLFPDPIMVRVTTVKAASIDLGGQVTPIRSNARTVGELLGRAKVTLSGRDLVMPAPDEPVTPGMVVHISRLRPGQKVVNTPIPFRTVHRASDLLADGETLVASEGAKGQLTTIYAQTRQDGKVVDTRQISRSITIPAEPRVILDGTRRNEPVPAPAPEATAYQPQGDSVWDRLAQCESTNNWQVNTGNGYYGGLQFDLPTWHEYGGTGYPHEHSREEQIAVAERLRAARGFAPWPVCGRRLGLL